MTRMKNRNGARGIGRRARGGQMAVVMALVMFTLVIFIAFATNMGILVNDRIRLQNSTDLAAYSGAYTQAAALNKMAKINDDILTTLYDCREQLTEVVWNGEPCLCEPFNNFAELIIEDCRSDVEKLVIDWKKAAEYSTTNQAAIEAAKHTMESNLVRLVEGSGGSHFFEGVSGSSTNPGIFNQGLSDYEQMVTFLNYYAYPDCPVAFGCVHFPPLPSEIRALPSYFVKRNREPNIWFMAQGSGTMAVPYLDIDYSSNGNDAGFFGGSSDGGTDKMYATAVAKPFDGSMGPTDAFIQDGPAGAAGGNDPGFQQTPGVWDEIGLDEPRLFIQPNYRARLAGINEWPGSMTPNVRPAAAISSTSALGPYNNPAEMLH